MADRPSKRPSATPEPAEGPGKGRPTPKRSKAEEANKRPLVPTDRKAAYVADRAKRKAARRKANQAMLTGDERYLPPRDKGPVRRYARDFVDARRNLAEYFLPASMAMVLLVIFGGQQATVALVAILALYIGVGIAVIDAVLMTRKLGMKVTEKFGDLPKGTRLYAAMRAFQIRRSRLPRPLVKRGEYPT